MQSKIFIEERIADSKKILHYSNNKFSMFENLTFAKERKKGEDDANLKKKKNRPSIYQPSTYLYHRSIRDTRPAERAPIEPPITGAVRVALKLQRRPSARRQKQWHFAVAKTEKENR